MKTCQSIKTLRMHPKSDKLNADLLGGRQTATR
jgi:hypothetical protein